MSVIMSKALKGVYATGRVVGKRKKAKLSSCVSKPHPQPYPKKTRLTDEVHMGDTLQFEA